MRSMTGFGEFQKEREGSYARVEISSVNSQHNHINMNLSDYPRFQREVEQRVRDRIERGTVDIQFHSNLLEENPSSIYVDDRLVEYYADQYRRIRAEFDVEGTMDVSRILSLPGVVRKRPDSKLDESMKSLFTEVLDQALDRLIEMRKEEGSTIADDLRDRLQTIEQHLDDIEERIPEALDRYRENLRDQIEEFLALPEDDVSERLENELKMYADKCDISEEIVRVRSHLEQFETYLDQSGSVGKSLEFLVQEIQREINTIGAKANDAEISQRSVDVKTELEKCREQIKNVE